MQKRAWYDESGKERKSITLRLCGFLIVTSSIVLLLPSDKGFDKHIHLSTPVDIIALLEAAQQPRCFFAAKPKENRRTGTMI